MCFIFQSDSIAYGGCIVISFLESALQILRDELRRSNTFGTTLEPKIPNGGESFCVCIIPWRGIESNHDGADMLYILWRDNEDIWLEIIADGRSHGARYHLGLVELSDEEDLIVQIESRGHVRGAPTWINLTFDIKEMEVTRAES